MLFICTYEIYKYLTGIGFYNRCRIFVMPKPILFICRINFYIYLLQRIINKQIRSERKKEKEKYEDAFRFDERLYSNTMWEIEAKVYCTTQLVSSHHHIIQTLILRPPHYTPALEHTHSVSRFWDLHYLLFENLFWCLFFSLFLFPFSFA